MKQFGFTKRHLNRFLRSFRRSCGPVRPGRTTFPPSFLGSALLFMLTTKFLVLPFFYPVKKNISIELTKVHYSVLGSSMINILIVQYSKSIISNFNTCSSPDANQ
jgi:hypothetical protein